MRSDINIVYCYIYIYIYELMEAYLEGYRTMKYEHFQVGTWVLGLEDDETFASGDYDPPTFSGSFASRCRTPTEHETYYDVLNSLLKFIHTSMYTYIIKQKQEVNEIDRKYYYKKQNQTVRNPKTAAYNRKKKKKIKLRTLMPSGLPLRTTN